MKIQSGILSAILAVSVMAGTAAVAQSVAYGDALSGQASETPRERLLRYEELIRDNPDDMAARLGLARALIDVGEYDRAEKMARVALRRERTETARLITAEALFWMGQAEEAETLLGSASFGGGEDMIALRAIVAGERSLQRGEPEEALRDIRQADGHDRFGDVARLIAARAQYARGDLFRAQRLVEEIVAKGRRNIPTMLLRAQMALRSGDVGRAQALSDEITAMVPGNVSASVIFVEAALRQNRIQAAKDRLATLNDVRSTDPRPAYLRALVYAAEGDYQAAANAVADVENWLSESDGGSVFLAELKLANGRERQAETILRRRLTVSPSDFTAQRLLIRLLDQSGRSNEADQLLDRTIAGGHATKSLLQLRIDRLLANGQYDTAEELLSSADTRSDDWVNALTEIQPDQPLSPPRLNDTSEELVRIVAALRSGDAPRAAGLASEALADDPQNPILLNILAAARLRSGDELTARRILSELTNQHPNFFAAIANMASLSPERDALAKALEAAIERGATTSRIFHQLGIERFVLGDVAGALEAADRAASAPDAVTRDFLLRSRLLLALGQNREAQELLTQLSQYATGDLDIRMGLAELLGEAGRPRVGASLLASQTLGDSPADQILLLAGLYEDAGDSRDALSVLSVARQSQPNDLRIAEAWLEALAARDLTWAQESLDAIDDLTAETRIALQGKLLAVAGRRSDAIQVLNRAPVSMQLLVAMAETAETPADRRIVMRKAASYLVDAPDDLRAILLLSGLALQANEATTAAQVLEAGLTLSPDNPILLNNLALARDRLGQEGAVSLAAEAYAILPTNAEIAETYARLLEAAGQGALASRIARRALLVSPGTTALRDLAFGPQMQ